MHIINVVVAAAILAAFGAQASAQAQQKQDKQERPPVIINDRSIYRPPPMPPDRTYVGPAPSIQPPMERIQPPAPLSPRP